MGRMKNVGLIAFLCSLTLVVCSRCGLIGGERLTTEALQERLEARYGKGMFTIREIDSKHWEVSLLKYPDITYTVTQKVGLNAFFPTPEYKVTDNRMEKVGAVVAPKYFSADELKGITYKCPIVEIRWDIKVGQDLSDLSRRVNAFCKEMQENYSRLVNGAVVNVFFCETPLALPSLDRKEPAKWGNVDEQAIADYMNGKYGAGNYTDNKGNSDDDDGEVKVRLKQYPDIPFSLSVQEKFLGFGKTLSDNRYPDVCAHLAFTFPTSDYGDTHFGELTAADHVCGIDLNGFFLSRYLVFKDAKDVIPKMLLLRNNLRKAIEQQPMLTFLDYPNKQEKVNPPILMKLSIRL